MTPEKYRDKYFEKHEIEFEPDKFIGKRTRDGNIGFFIHCFNELVGLHNPTYTPIAYWNKDGYWDSNCLNGWFDSEEEALLNYYSYKKEEN